MKEICRTHHVYASQRAAEKSATKIAMRALRTGKDGSSWKRLNVFQCEDHWHVGRKPIIGKTMTKRLCNKTLSKAQDIVQEALANVADALGEPFYTAAMHSVIDDLEHLKAHPDCPSPQFCESKADDPRTSAADERLNQHRKLIESGFFTAEGKRNVTLARHVWTQLLSMWKRREHA